MNLIVCLDSNNGMAFNNRRQSRDKLVIDDIAATIQNNRLITTSYSKSLFRNPCLNIITNDEGNVEFKCDDYLFCELEVPNPLPDLIDTVIIYKWNRQYPADVYFSPSLFKNMHLISSVEIKGYSHEKITREVYRIEKK